MCCCSFLLCVDRRLSVEYLHAWSVPNDHSFLPIHLFRSRTLSFQTWWVWAVSGASFMLFMQFMHAILCVYTLHSALCTQCTML